MRQGISRRGATESGHLECTAGCLALAAPQANDPFCQPRSNQRGWMRWVDLLWMTGGKGSSLRKIYWFWKGPSHVCVDARYMVNWAWRSHCGSLGRWRNPADDDDYSNTPWILHVRQHVQATYFTPDSRRSDAVAIPLDTTV